MVFDWPGTKFPISGSGLSLDRSLYRDGEIVACWHLCMDIGYVEDPRLADSESHLLHACWRLDDCP